MMLTGEHGEKPVLMSFHPPQIPHVMFWDGAGTLMVGCRRLTNLRHDTAEHNTSAVTDMMVAFKQLY